jgi:gas vesicle protein
MLDHLDIRMLREREDHAATQGFMGGMLLGVLLGVVITLVFAPRRGEETRAVVAHAAADVKDKAAQLVNMGVHHESHDGAGNDFGDGAAIEREIGDDSEATVPA